ncbi:MAG: DUF4037 domain-containing protein [Desulfovibrionaceae bacterium]|nr:DUF4037 domain-containing protein [Desulfovibrionaceae bacterium]
MADSRRGLDLARQLYEEYGRTILEERLPDLVPHMAVGLVGEGSECFGFDDEISRDHDWGPAFCIWLPQDMLIENVDRIDAALARLPETYAGFAVRMAPDVRMNRVGPLPIEGFYRRFLNVPRCPETLAEWRAIPETYLAVATNGEVFADPAGIFSGIRSRLLDFYPEDIRIKKLAARCVAAAQAGQYNLPRMMSRYACTAVNICRIRFTEAIISMVFLLHRRYMPFYKWADKAMAALSPLGAGISASLEQLNCLSPLENSARDFSVLVEDICQRMVDELMRQGLTTSNDPWLYEQGPAVQAHVQNEALRSLPVQFE